MQLLHTARALYWVSDASVSLKTSVDAAIAQKLSNTIIRILAKGYATVPPDIVRVLSSHCPHWPADR